MANQWVRLWLDMPTCPKFRTIAKASGQPLSAVISVFVLMMTDAANASERGRTHMNDEDVASALDLEPEQISAIRSAMQGRVLDGDYLTGWEARQPIREDGSAERSRAWREAKKANASERKRTQRTHMNDEDVASALDLGPEQVSAACNAMQSRVFDGDDLTGTVEISTEITSTWSDEKKANASERKRTQRDAPDTDTDTDKDKDKKELPTVVPKKSAFGVSDMTELPADVAEDLIRHRRAKRAPLTKTSWQGLLAEFSTAGLTPEDGVRHMLANGWQGFKAEWVHRPRGSPTANTAMAEPQRRRKLLGSAT